MFFRGNLPTFWVNGPTFALEPEHLSNTMVSIGNLLTKHMNEDRLDESKRKTLFVDCGVPSDYNFNISDFYIKKIEVPVIVDKKDDDECIYIYKVMAGKNVIEYCDNLDVAKNVALSNVAKETPNIYVLAAAVPV